MRLFVAVCLPAEIRERLASVQDRLRRARADVSWVKPANLHVTVKFLGETEPKLLPRIRPVLADAARKATAFAVTLAGVGTFGGRIPRVVWVGIREGAERLAPLAVAVEEGLAGVGFPKEKRGFAGHFTLGRVRSPNNVEALLAALRDEPTAPLGTVPVDRFILMQSELHPSGSVYSEIEAYPLGEPEREERGKETRCESPS
ncbi:MAG: RNA 2',3'-cyclic phosphodiesterase [Zetaproteobacteria bacterium]|nr:MAG: RNA 2',3'-cyclic phosphodiesterase [Zetaproteobacteria bacterium]